MEETPRSWNLLVLVISREKKTDNVRDRTHDLWFIINGSAANLSFNVSLTLVVAMVPIGDKELFLFCGIAQSKPGRTAIY